MMTETSPSAPIEPTLARLRRVGVDTLSDAEVLALAIGRGRHGLSSRDLALHLLSTHDGVRGLSRVGVGSLALDLGEHRAARIIAALELARRARCVPLSRRAPLSSSRDVVRAYGPRLLDAAEECVVAVVLDARNRPVAERIIARGTTSACAVGAREVFTLVVREGGTSTLVVHNHPSGDPTPSDEDIAFTRSLIEAGRLLDVPLVDHIIVARDGTFSFLDAGLMRTEEDGPCAR